MRWRVAFLLAWLSCAAVAERRTVTLLATTDLHGNIYPVDYYTSRPAARGLAKLATLIRQARAGNPTTLLVDCGDTIQGTPLESVYQSLVRSGRMPLDLPRAPLAQDPMMLAMNRLGYDAMTVGNHEFNFGLKNLERARADARFPWLAANIEAGAGGAPFAPYMLKDAGGVKIAVVGLVTPAVPGWEKPENLGPYRFLPARAGLARALDALRAERPDLVIVAAHAGLGRDLGSGAPRQAEENFVYDLAASEPGVDAIVFGHSHQELASYRVGPVLLVQPKNWGISLARLDFVMERGAGGRWAVVEKSSRLMPVTAETPADPEILELARPYHEAAERYLNTPVADSPRELDARLGRVCDSALVDAVQAVQMHYAGADVSLTALFNPRARVPRGPVTVRQIAALYIYDNELYAVEGDGAMLKQALENAARYFRSCQGAACLTPPLTNPDVMGFNYDMAQGVEYEIDLTRPVGERVRNLRYRGRPLEPSQKLRIAVNNYRAAGSAGYGMLARAKVVWRSNEEIRDLMVRYYTERRTLPGEPDGNWRIVPDEAARTLAAQALAEAAPSAR